VKFRRKHLLQFSGIISEKSACRPGFSIDFLSGRIICLFIVTPCITMEAGFHMRRAGSLRADVEGFTIKTAQIQVE
jgi:hypothetical protein